MQLVLVGELITPLLTNKRTFYLKGCKWRITKAQRISYLKVAIAFPSYPFACTGYTGQVTVTYQCKSLKAAKNKLKDLSQITRIGSNRSLELGKIQWLEYTFEESPPISWKKQYGKIKIRKGLPSGLPPEIQELVLYGLLHDFFHTTIHKSKIYLEPPLENQALVEVLRQSHSDTTHLLIETFKKYDGIASYLTRRSKAPRMTRYNWQTAEDFQLIDFEVLATQIAQVVNTRNVFKLYLLIYQSQDLESLNESLDFGHTSLRYHLLLIANFIVRDYLHGYLDAFLKAYQVHFLHSSEKTAVAS
ncbi:MAG: hypothetical protein ACFE9L_00130 [Candidatus Hodarchaeota archaeon]